ncbi:AfsR/SARP family transcriptional regulator [Amycolatopsis jiangsuensis]|uniref:DNA-binding SARP family transcriptional activator/predicted negative regulator of RcsB-dependent stress response n=1 Tax=Amycolatopsis jiangsuensis TaxID=1181879 RepID=A0A840J3A7_9PSEU|nr:BTAD domain-containing putative transcriptional regulator [Amycolatopsis jiangsuensis]MBB4687902.1 DNA-binding SARP family transcriptional activator/predicted negative regulator of RcsB-dependent stress response [Amycolatopsis jiangsuensis]
MADAGARVELLGPVRLLDGARTVPIGGPAVKGLLALLALRVGKIVPLEEIIDALWGHDPPATARTIVHGNVSHLRRILRQLRTGPVAEIHTSPPGYQLAVAPERIDVHRARALFDRATLEPPEGASRLLAEALALWQGPALSGVPDSVRAPELADLRLAIHGARIDADLRLGRHNELIVELSPIVRADPLAERTAAQLMRALYHAGRRGEALELYRTVFRATLRTLGVEPGVDLRWLHERVLNDDLVAQEDAAPVSVVAAATPAQLPPALPALAGREADLAWLDGLPGGVAVVSGTAGVGKSALVVWWAHRAARHFPDGVLFASLHGFDPHHAPREPGDLLAQFLLGLGVPADEVPEPLPERVALYRSLIAGRRMLVLLDDARSAEQVRPLLPPGPGSRTVVTSRSRLEALAVSDAAKLRVLGTLAADDAVRVIEELAGPADFDLNHALARLCGYLPLALRIAGARLAASPQWTTEDLVAELGNERTRLAALDVTGADDGVRAAFDVSFRGLPGELAHTLLRLGAVPGRQIGPHLAAAVAEIPVAQARRELRTLAAQSLLTETARDVFAPHDLVRLYLRDLAETELTPQERAAVLDRAVRYYQAASDTARRKMLRIVDPLDLTGLVAPESLPPLRTFDEAQDWFAAEWPTLLAVLDAAYARQRYADVWRLARVGHTYRVVCPLYEDWSRLVDIGLGAAEAADEPLGVCWMLISRCAIALTFELSRGSLEDAERAVALAGELGDERSLAVARIHLGSVLTLLGRYDEAIACLLETAAEAERAGDLELRGQALNNCAETEKRAGRTVEAIGHELASLEIDRELGDDSYAVVSLNNLAELHLDIGELDTAERYATEAVSLAVTRQFELQEGILRVTLARILRAKPAVGQARAEYGRALDLYERMNPRHIQALRQEAAELN